MKNVLMILVFTASVSASLLLGIRYGRESAVKQHRKETGIIIEELKSYRSILYEVEKKVSSGVPIYEDFRTAALESELRSYLYPYHKKIAEKYGVLIESDEEIQPLVEDGSLIKVEPSDGYYFYGVPKKYRYCTPKAKEALDLIQTRFSQKVGNLGIENTSIKFAVSSLLRPVQYQKNLRSSNTNAINESTHSYGVSFDIFFEDFYVSVETGEKSPAFSYISIIQPRTGFMLGDSLRRQLHTLLAQTVLELQREGKIYAIFEYRQKVFHVTFTEDFYNNQ